MRKTAMLGVLVLLAVLVMPTASAHVTMYFEPQDRSVSGGYPNTANVRLMANITSPDNLLGGQVAIYHTQICVNITNLQWGPQIFTMMSSWNAAKVIDPCPGENHDWIMFAFMSSQTGVVEICNLTIQCNCSSCDYCISPMDFTCGISGCSSCPIEVLKDIGGGTENLYPAHATLVNGTFTCGIQPAGTCGDVNDDGVINMADVMTLWYDYANYPTPGAHEVSNDWAADVNCDQTINMADVMTLWYDYANYPTPGAHEVNCC